MQQSKIDEVVNQKIDRINEKGRGFVLDMVPDIAIPMSRIGDLCIELGVMCDDPDIKDQPDLQQIKGKIIDLLYAYRQISISCFGAKVEVRESLPPVDEYVPHALGRNHSIGDTDSFIRYALKYGDPDKSLVMYNDESVYLVIDESIERGDREIIQMSLVRSVEWRSWDRLIGEPVVHKDLYKFLSKWSLCLDKPDTLESMRTVRANVSVKHDSDLQDDGDKVGVFFTSSGGQELKKFPKQFSIHLPVLDQDAVADPETWHRVQINLDIDLPTEPGKPVVFTLQCPTWHLVLRQRVHEECKKIAEELSGWTVVRGNHDTFPKRIGRNAKPSSSF